VTGVAIYRVAGGKCVERWVELSLLGLLQQLGAVPTMPAPPVPMSGETAPSGYLCTDGRRMAYPTCRNHSQFLVVKGPSRPRARSVIAA
jgi:hypothetical protein